jgi:hypothetical protein
MTEDLQYHKSVYPSPGTNYLGKPTVLKQLQLAVKPLLSVSTYEGRRPVDTMCWGC